MNNEDAEAADNCWQITDKCLSSMIPWHIQEARRLIRKEARRDIRERDFFDAEMNIAIAERMIAGTWFNEKEFKRLLIKNMEKDRKPLCEQGINFLYP